MVRLRVSGLLVSVSCWSAWAADDAQNKHLGPAIEMVRSLKPENTS
jgi:hypothetical protein